jgi:putative addiction module component (TIGR02574 family)
MSATEILEQFRRLPFKERCEVLQRMRDEFEDESTPEQIAEFEERAGKLRRHPEKGIAWEKVREELKNRSNKRRACAGT